LSAGNQGKHRLPALRGWPFDFAHSEQLVGLVPDGGLPNG